MNFFVTGGSRGIGGAIVRDALAAGHDVAFTYVTRPELAAEQIAWAKENTPSRDCRAYELDVSESDAVDRVTDQVLTDFDTVDVVVNNAATNRIGLAVSLSDEDWRAVIDTNLSGTFFVCRQFLPEFLSNKRGRFIHMSSIAAAGMAGQAAYSASKAGLTGLSLAIAKEYGAKGITSNVLALGYFDTDMTREQMTDGAKDFWRRFCPTGRVGTLNEISQAVLYLASDAAAFINGETISLMGGLTWAP